MHEPPSGSHAELIQSLAEWVGKMPMHSRCVCVILSLIFVASTVPVLGRKHSKTPYITPRMDFYSAKGVVRGRRGQQLYGTYTLDTKEVVA